MNNKLITLAITSLIYLSVSSSVIAQTSSTSSGSTGSGSLAEQDAAYKAEYRAEKQKYLNEVAFYKQAKQDYLDAKQKYLAFKKAEDKQVVLDKAKIFLNQAVKTVIKRLQALRVWVVNEPGFSDADRNASLNEIDNDINYLQTEQPKIDSATLEQLKVEAKDIKEHWLNIRYDFKKIVGRVMLARTNYLLAKADNFSAMVSTKITEQKAKGKDTTKLEAWLADFNKNKDLAKQKRDQAKLTYDQANNLKDVNQFFKNANQFIKDSNKYLVEAHKQLKEIIKELKQQSATEK